MGKKDNKNVSENDTQKVFAYAPIQWGIRTSTNTTRSIEK